MLDFLLKTDKEIAKVLAQRIKNERVLLNYTQKEFSKISGIPISKIRRFEQSGDIKLVDLIRVIKTINKQDILSSLFDFKKERIEQDAFEYSDTLEAKYERKRASGK